MAAPVQYRTNGHEPSTVTITEPGVYELDEEQYHKDPVPAGSLSSTGARKLLTPSCPALFKHERDNPPAPKRTFDYGHAAHLKVLGVGAPLVVVDADDWRTAKAQAQRAEAYAAGATPLLRAEADRVDAMAAALKRHPKAARLLDPDFGTSEQSLFWVDPEFDVWRRARLDHFTTLGNGQPVIVDFKSTYDAEPGHLRKAFHNFGYHCQDPWYCDAAIACGLAEDPAFLFVAQMKEPPFLVTIVDFDDEAIRIGRERNRRALDVYRQCTETGVWPGFTDDIHTLSLPAYAARQHDEEFTP